MNTEKGLIYVNIDDLKPYENNPRINDKAVDSVAKSIEEFGFKVPIVVDKNNVIVAGHTRWKASKKLGLDEVPVIVADDLTDDQIKAFRLADNKVGELADWDFSKLEEELANIEMDMTKFDFNMKELEKEFAKNREVVEDDFDIDEAIESIDEPICQMGDIWQLGNHRLMCGDSTDKGTVFKLMDGKKADMVFTDPPYNVSIGTIKHPKFKQREIKNDNMSRDDFKRFCSGFISNIKEFTTGCVYMCAGQGEDGRVMFTIADEMMHCSTTIIWNKDQFTLGRGKYQNKYEPIWFGWVENGSDFTDDRTLTNVWDIPRPKNSELHPTMKPIEIIARAFSHNPKSETILDLFGGSGSTLIACEQLNRRCYMMELDPKYCDVIIKRWETLTSKEAVKL